MDYSYSQVTHNTNHTNTHTQFAGLRSIQPVAAQILSAADSNGRALHIELDSAATVSYITLAEATKRQFPIKANNQVSHLGDGLTSLKSCGEIDITIYRNEHPLRFRALVAQHLHCTAIGGTTFIKDNNIKQDFTNNIIHLLGNTCIVHVEKHYYLCYRCPLPTVYTASALTHVYHTLTHVYHTHLPLHSVQGSRQQALIASPLDTTHQHTLGISQQALIASPQNTQ